MKDDFLCGGFKFTYYAGRAFERAHVGVFAIDRQRARYQSHLVAAPSSRRCNGPE